MSEPGPSGVPSKEVLALLREQEQGMDSDEDEILVEALDQVERQAEGSVEFDLAPSEDRRFRHGDVRLRVFRARLRQPDLAHALPANGMGNAIEGAFARTINRLLEEDPTLEDESILFRSTQSHAFQHACQQTSDAIYFMERLARGLNSNNALGVNDTFT